MTYFATSKIGVDLASIDTVAKHQLGSKVKAIDPVLGEGEFIYLGGGASVIANAAVIYNPSTSLVTINPVTGGLGPVAWALGAVTAALFGWFQISGVAISNTPDAVVAGADVYSDAAVAGAVDDAAVANEQLVGAAFASASGTPAAGKAYVRLSGAVAHAKMS